MKQSDTFFAPLAKTPVPIQDTYNVEETALLLHVGRNYIYELMGRREDPLPFIRISEKSKGCFIMRDDLIAWVRRNAAPAKSRSIKG